MSIASLFLHSARMTVSAINSVELMWGVSPVTKARLAEIGVLTIGQLARTPGGSLEPSLGRGVRQKLAALAWNRDPRENQDASSMACRSLIVLRAIGLDVGGIAGPHPSPAY